MQDDILVHGRSKKKIKERVGRNKRYEVVEQVETWKEKEEKKKEFQCKCKQPKNIIKKGEKRRNNVDDKRKGKIKKCEMEKRQ